MCVCVCVCVCVEVVIVEPRGEKQILFYKEGLQQSLN